MSVHQRKDGRWYVAFSEDGKARTKSFGRGLEGERKANEFNDSLDLRTWTRRTPVEHSVQFSELVNEYAEAKANEWPKESMDNFLWKMAGVIFPKLGHLPVMQTTDKHLVQYVAGRLEKVKATTVHRELSDIQAVLNWGVEMRYIAYNPVARFKKPKRDDAIISPPRIHEIDALIAHSPPHVVKALTLSYYTGLRPGKRELFNLTWDRVDFEAVTILIISAQKGGLRKREIPLHPDMAQLLKEWQQQDKCEYIINWRGKKIGSIKTAWKAAKKKAGITRRLRPYDFRHAFASSILKNRADLKSASELLGHTRTDTTTRIYQHTDTDMHRDAINRVQSIKPIAPIATPADNNVIEFKTRKQI